MISEGLGVGLNISENGILLETPDHIKSGLLILAATDGKSNLVEVKAKLVHTRKTSNGTFLAGIKFIGAGERLEHFISNLIKDYNFRGENLHIAIRQKVDKRNQQTITYKQL